MTNLKHYRYDICDSHAEHVFSRENNNNNNDDDDMRLTGMCSTALWAAVPS